MALTTDAINVRRQGRLLRDEPIKGQVFKFHFWHHESDAMWVGMAVREESQGWIARPKMKFEDLTPARTRPR